MTSSTPQLFVETVTERFCGHVLASDIRPATQEDIAQAAALHARGECPHNIVYDVAGWMYDYRRCGTCGKGLGAI